MLPFVLFHPRFWLLMSVAAVFGLGLLANAISAGPFSLGDTSPSTTALLYINPAARLFEFIVGVITAMFWLKKPTPPSDIPALAVQIAAIGFVAASWSMANQLASAASHPAATDWLAHGGVTCFSSAALIYAFATRYGLARIISVSPLVYLGKISFALYLVHQIPVHALNLGIEPFNMMTWREYLIFSLGSAAILHHAIEEPFRLRIIAAYDAIRARPSVQAK